MFTNAIVQVLVVKLSLWLDPQFGDCKQANLRLVSPLTLSWCEGQEVSLAKKYTKYASRSFASRSLPWTVPLLRESAHELLVQHEAAYTDTDKDIDIDVPEY